ncbi:MAG TPA: chromate transporter [Tepidisphaeraceae bacterium]|nr:chromate transporter [Tepidisphaeraceae bacterium]
MNDRTARLRELAKLFTKLGFTAFGGPAAHIAMMEDEVVARRQWLDRTHFMDIVAAVNFVPGPNSTELAIHIGQLREGFVGLVVAGFCFITPAVLIILAIAWAYVAYGTLPQVHSAMIGISAAVVAIVASALIRFARTGIKDSFTTIIAVFAFPAAILLRRYSNLQPEIVVLAIAAIVGAIWYGRPRVDRLPILALPLPAVASIAWFFFKIGATLFGSGYVLVSYLQSGLVVQRHWLTNQELLDAIAVGQFTPGPLLTTATFIGYLLGNRHFGGGIAGGVVAAIVATLAIFLPSFIFVAIFGPMLQRIRHNRYARGALDAMNAAVVSLILVVLINLGQAALKDWLTILIACASLTLLLWRNINSTWIILSAGLLGLLLRSTL